MTDVDLQTPNISYAFEHVAAKLVPFDLDELAQAANGGSALTSSQLRSNADNRTSLVNSDFNNQGNRTSRTPRSLGPTGDSQNLQGVLRKGSHPLGPIVETLGLVFPYNPSISEKIGVKYDAIDLTHSNESYYSYKATDNVRISISNAVWTCDTFENAVYALSALHFFRAYSYMDFGGPRAANKRPSGRPPAPMWFSAYGQYAFNRVPCLMESADWTWPNDVDYVGIPEPGSVEWKNRIIKTKRDASSQYTWMPIKFEVSSISLIVQHSPLYWINWNLEDFRSGSMLDRGGFHRLPKDGIIR